MPKTLHSWMPLIAGVNLPESMLVPSNAQFVDVNNYPNIGRWLRENGLTYPVGLSVHSGYVTYPLYQFHLPNG